MNGGEGSNSLKPFLLIIVCPILFFIDFLLFFPEVSLFLDIALNHLKLFGSGVQLCKHLGVLEVFVIIFHEHLPSLFI